MTENEQEPVPTPDEVRDAFIAYQRAATSKGAHAEPELDDYWALVRRVQATGGRRP